MRVNRRAVIAAAVFASTRGVWAQPAPAFDIETAERAPVRNFRIAPGQSPQNLPGVIVNGPAETDLVLYEFLDYACPHCRAAAQEIDVLLSPEAGFRLGLVQHPILSPGSIEAARVVLAAAKLLGDAAAYGLHLALYETPGRAGEAKALAVASARGLDAAALKRAADAADVSAILAAQAERAQALELNLTPAFVLGDYAFVGWPGADTVASLVAATRRCGGLRCSTM